MSVYSIALPEEILLFGSGYPVLEIRASQTDYLKVLDVALNVFNDTAAAVNGVTLGFGLSGAAGVPLTAYKLYPEDPYPTLGAAEPGAYVSTAWSTFPTIPVNFNRRLTAGSKITGANANGSMPIQFSFSKGFVVPFGGSAVVWIINTSLGTVMVPTDVTIVVDV
jgi:hypothetical protein